MAETPCSRVLGTVELLENVLSHLDNKTLLLSQRVSKTFEATITGSTQLQQKLFFKIIPAGARYLCNKQGCEDESCVEPLEHNTSKAHHNPLLSDRDFEVVAGKATISMYANDGLWLRAEERYRPAGTEFKTGTWRRAVGFPMQWIRAAVDLWSPRWLDNARNDA
ncbi:hypothetical protein LTR22_026636 [Elasticomyces elasticus]|nr:hypothetical protein LTR22_026636 [Elasticomyces elasticus]KAK4918711.1 hypothetical protein LTR49_013498 [Elasticomyces elasticus]